MKNQIAMVSSENTHPCEAVGCRVESATFFGTVRYIGELPDHPGIWYGIEWDNPCRGKHNGTVNGVQYFQTRHPTAGSFVRRERLNFGKSLIEAIISRYGGQESDIVRKIKEQQIMSFQKTIKAPFVEFVGFDKVCNKQSNFESLTIVSVRLQNVSYIGEPDELKTYFPNIRELDLSKNLITSWNNVFNVCSQLDQLYWLTVSENLLTFPEICPNVFPNITVFVCGHMNLTWEDIKKLSNIFPNINELRANNNNITDLTLEETNNFQNLALLDLEENEIISWDEIIKLKNIKSLQNLTIGGIGLEKIDFKTDDKKIDYFKNVTKLCISNNNINDWKSVSELNRLPMLEELKFSNNPILKNEDSMEIVIAKIGSLKIYNGRKFNDEDRRGSEYDYLKKYGMEWLRVKNTPNQTEFLNEHNRYLELIELYGELEAHELKVPETSLKNSLINLKILFEDQKISKKVSPSMLVQKLQILVQKVFKLDEQPELICQNEDGFEIPLDDETKDLGYYYVKNDNTIIVKV